MLDNDAMAGKLLMPASTEWYTPQNQKYVTPRK